MKADMRTLLPISKIILILGINNFVSVAAGKMPFPPNKFGFEPAENSFSYTVCNGLSNQILYHAVSLAVALKYDKEIIFVPDFIVDGTQHGGIDVLPTAQNSIPFAQAFDVDHFVNTIQSLATTGIKPRIVFQTEEQNDGNNKHAQPKCPQMWDLRMGDPILIRSIVEDAFRPSAQLQNVIDKITAHFPKASNTSGMCVHHRDGEDWHEHCVRWSQATKKDGVFRQNCLGQSDETFLESLMHRGLQLNQERESDSWIYYCGDHDPPDELSSVVKVFRKDDLFFQSTNKTSSVVTEKAAAAAVESEPSWLANPSRDVSALIDFFVCRSIGKFVGNSVSTFSALQIALRHGRDSYWYNSQSIPLASMWNGYVIPIVYTYTEENKESRKLFLQASINSVQQHMTRSTPIHILYNGSQDEEFIQWLKSKDVTIHWHNPSWKDKIDSMRKNGDPSLLSNAGYFLGTWQRIDIPLFLDTEYALLLDADTILMQPLTLIDFGLDLTKSIAMSSEADFRDKRPLDAGIMLMNIPNLRRTHEGFLDYIFNPIHINTAKFENGALSHRGAYLGFYKDTVAFLDVRFNFKPYWSVPKLPVANAFKQTKIIHFHGSKPHDYIEYIALGKQHDEGFDIVNMPYLCPTIQAFASNTESNEGYCQLFLTNQTEIDTCFDILESLNENTKTIHGENKVDKSCDNFVEYVQKRIQDGATVRKDAQGYHENVQERQDGLVENNILMDKEVQSKYGTDEASQRLINEVEVLKEELQRQNEALKEELQRQNEAIQANQQKLKEIEGSLEIASQQHLNEIELMRKEAQKNALPHRAMYAYYPALFLLCYIAGGMRSRKLRKQHTIG